MRAKSKQYRRHMGKASDVLWMAVAVLVLCAVLFVRACGKAMVLG
jgi:hypothetical protein